PVAEQCRARLRALFGPDDQRVLARLQRLHAFELHGCRLPTPEQFDGTAELETAANSHWNQRNRRDSTKQRTMHSNTPRRKWLAPAPAPARPEPSPLPCSAFSSETDDAHYDKGVA